MKKILLSGVNSYIGLAFIKWVKENGFKNYQIDTITLKDDHWKNKDLSGYDTIVHLAAIVHSSSTDSSLFYTVNRDLATEFAIKAKQEGVRHFIFFSSMSVYGLNHGQVNTNTQPNPSNDYGQSKFEAEKNIISMESSDFQVTILRPPMVYGPESPGNFQKIIKLFSITPFFPCIKNNRSMIYIDNLSEFLHIIIQRRIGGIYIPQNEEYVSVSSIYKTYRELNNKKTIFFPLYIPKFILNKIPVVSKVFGDLTVTKEMSEIPLKYQNISFTQSIYDSVKERNSEKR